MTKTKQETVETATEFATEFAHEIFRRCPGVFSSEQVFSMAARAGVAFALGATSAEVSTVVANTKGS